MSAEEALRFVSAVEWEDMVGLQTGGVDDVKRGL
jgi:hypothetical protein